MTDGQRKTYELQMRERSRSMLAESQKAPVDVMVVDRIEKPSEN